MVCVTYASNKNKKFRKKNVQACICLNVITVTTELEKRNRISVITVLNKTLTLSAKLVVKSFLKLTTQTYVVFAVHIKKRLKILTLKKSRVKDLNLQAL